MEQTSPNLETADVESSMALGTVTSTAGGTPTRESTNPLAKLPDHKAVAASVRATATLTRGMVKSGSVADPVSRGRAEGGGNAHSHVFGDGRLDVFDAQTHLRCSHRGRTKPNRTPNNRRGLYGDVQS